MGDATTGTTADKLAAMEHVDGRRAERRRRPVGDRPPISRSPANWRHCRSARPPSRRAPRASRRPASPPCWRWARTHQARAMSQHWIYAQMEAMLGALAGNAASGFRRHGRRGAAGAPPRRRPTWWRAAGYSSPIGDRRCRGGGRARLMATEKSIAGYSPGPDAGQRGFRKRVASLVHGDAVMAFGRHRRFGAGRRLPPTCRSRSGSITSRLPGAPSLWLYLFPSCNEDGSSHGPGDVVRVQPWGRCRRNTTSARSRARAPATGAVTGTVGGIRPAPTQGPLPGLYNLAGATLRRLGERRADANLYNRSVQ